LRVARHVDPAQEIPRRRAPVHRAHDLVRGRPRLGVHRAGDEFARRLSSADGHAAELEMRALAQPGLDFQPRVIAPGVDREYLRPRAIADGDAETPQLGRGPVEDEADAPGLTGREFHDLPLAETLGRER